MNNTYGKNSTATGKDKYFFQEQLYRFCAQATPDTIDTIYKLRENLTFTHDQTSKKNIIDAKNKNLYLYASAGFISSSFLFIALGAMMPATAPVAVALFITLAVTSICVGIASGVYATYFRKREYKNDRNNEYSANQEWLEYNLRRNVNEPPSLTDVIMAESLSQRPDHILNHPSNFRNR